MPIIDPAMPAEQYHATDAVSASLLKQIAKSPAHAKAYLSQQQEPTAAMLFGTAFHCAVLEYEKFTQQYAVFVGDKRTKDGKATYEALVAEGKTTKEAARQLGVSVKTIETHRKRIMDKLGASSVAELTKCAIRMGLTTVDIAGIQAQVDADIPPETATPNRPAKSP